MNKPKTILLLLSALLTAQATHAAEPTDTVSLGFRDVAARDLMGGVSVVDMAALTEHDYSTYSLDYLGHLAPHQPVPAGAADTRQLRRRA